MMASATTPSRSRNLRNLIAYAGHHGARYLFPLVVTPFLAKMLGTSQFAELVIWNSSVWSCSIIIEFGFYMFAVTETARANSDRELDEVLASVITAKLLLMPIAIAAYLVLAHFLGLLSHHPLVVIFGVLAVAAYGGSFAWYFQGRERGFTAVLVEISPQVLQCGLVLLLVRSADDLGTAITLQVLAAICPVAISFAIIQRERHVGFATMMTALRSMMRSFPYFMERFCFTAYSAATPLVLATLSTHQQAGYYGISDKVNAFLTGLSIPATQLMLPIIARKTASGAGWRLSFMLILALTLATGAISAVLFFALGPLIQWFFGPSYAPAVTVARWFCVASVLFVYQTAIANFVIIPSGRARLMAFASGGALAVSLAAQWILVPLFGAAGSAMARTAAETCVAGAFTIAVLPLVRSKIGTVSANRRNGVAQPTAHDDAAAVASTSALLERIVPDEYV